MNKIKYLKKNKKRTDNYYKSSQDGSIDTIKSTGTDIMLNTNERYSWMRNFIETNKIVISFIIITLILLFTALL
ncbi:hypothetical protein GCM10022393_10610 [Aquimarina addita]|uniref:Uncharacterized protein n=1 Tax=Aquimarina addita TaxID=870485 RepID=A0ABP7XD57_9FLAO